LLEDILEGFSFFIVFSLVGFSDFEGSFEIFFTVDEITFEEEIAFSDVLVNSGEEIFISCFFAGTREFFQSIG